MADDRKRIGAKRSAPISHGCAGWSSNARGGMHEDRHLVMIGHFKQRPHRFVVKITVGITAGDLDRANAKVFDGAGQFRHRTLHVGQVNP